MQTLRPTGHNNRKDHREMSLNAGFKALKDAFAPEKAPDSPFDVAFPISDDKVHLRLVKTHDKEVICDQYGRELDGVIGFRYEQVAIDVCPKLTVLLRVRPCDWGERLGETICGEPATLEPRPFGKLPGVEGG
jgi:hypothetical protein